LEQCGQPLDQLQERQAEVRDTIGLGIREAIDELAVGKLLKPLHAGAVGSRDARRTIGRHDHAMECRRT
jgi:hypothetical protein